jgi:predicted DNA binding CopG/RHH family protein
MKKAKKVMPHFKSEAEERAFREAHDSTDYVDWSKSVRAHFPNLKPTTTSISLRLAASTLERLKIAANKRDIPYQSLLKMWLDEKLDMESVPAMTKKRNNAPRQPAK